MAPSVDLDVLIVGAGISGINAAYRLQTEAPTQSFAIIESRNSIGGTWDLFKYPGIRSDSDLHTFGFAWKPWSEPKSIAEGPAIVKYIKQCAAENGIDKKVRFQHKLLSANWDSTTRTWTSSVSISGAEPTDIVSRFVLFSTGYYNYNEPLETIIPGIDSFKGTRIHPQFWPEDLDYSNKKVVIIGSGATAITLLPNMCEKAAHVTMLQRSPGYIVNLPQEDAVGHWAHKLLPHWLAFKIVRAKFLIIPLLFFKFCRRFPNAARRAIKMRTLKELPAGTDYSPNFDPKYNPWEQRLCVCPDGDYFKCLKSGKASVVTTTIKNITEDSIVLDNGETLRPDIIVTATGLKIQMAGGTKISVDGKPYSVTSKFLWKGIMLQDLPNAAVVLGYTNASWTLGADATAFWLCRFLNHLDQNRYSAGVPRMQDPTVKASSPFNLNSTYVEKAKGEMPKAGDKGPWKARSSYFTDLWEAQKGSLTDSMEFFPIKA